MGSALLSVFASAGMAVDAMIVAYTDESGHSGDSKIVAMGGIVGSHMDMDILGQRWRDTLHRHGDVVFHMNEIEGREKKRREAIFRDTFACMEGLLFMVFGAVVIVEQYRKLPELAQEFLIDPWFICFQMCVSQIAGSMIFRFDDPTIKEKIAIFHDQQREYQGRAVSAFQFLKDSDSQFGKRLGTCTPASKVDVIQLQVADLVAYEVRKLVENAIYNPDIPTRWPMLQLQKHPYFFRYLDYAGMVPDIEGGPITAFSKHTFKVSGGKLFIEAIGTKFHDTGWRYPPPSPKKPSLWSRLFSFFKWW